jgi:AcrR family transcriptional regulator
MTMARTRAVALRPKIQAPAASEITHTRFLLSAERLFCVNGYEGTKIRAIATLSNANLGMLSHYWGSKRALFREVFDRRLRPIHEERMRRFRELERLLKAGKPVSIVEVLEAQIEPAFVPEDQSAAEANALRALLGRALTDPSEEVVTVMGEIFDESANSFFSLLKRAAPNIDHSEFYWRANCVVGAFTFAESYTNRLTRFIDEDLSDIDWHAASQYVVRFLAAGMRAPAASNALVDRARRASVKRRKPKARAA